MGLLVAATGLAIIALAIGLCLQGLALRKLRNAHVNLAAEVGVVRRETKSAIDGCATWDTTNGLRAYCDENHAYAKSLQEDLAAVDSTTKSLNERLVLLEIEKTAVPKPPEEPPPARRSFASQKARAEAGARK